VSFKIVAEQFQKATAALSEARKFNESSTWPPEMSTMRKNLLQTGKCDEEVSVNHGNEHTLLSSLLDMYRKFCQRLHHSGRLSIVKRK